MVKTDETGAVNIGTVETVPTSGRATGAVPSVL